MKKKISDMFEGPGSSLHRTFEGSILKANILKGERRRIIEQIREEEKTKLRKGEVLMFNQFLESAESVGFTVDQSSFLWYWIEAISKKDL